jgi:hypothetical protein
MFYNFRNIVQTDFKCCGVENYKDWHNVTFGKTGNVPDSCCKDFTSGCGQDVLNDPILADKVFNDGCFKKLETVNSVLLMQLNIRPCALVIGT